MTDPSHVLYAASAIPGINTQRVVATGPRQEMEALRADRRAADDASHRYSTCYWVERA